MLRGNILELNAPRLVLFACALIVVLVLVLEMGPVGSLFMALAITVLYQDPIAAYLASTVLGVASLSLVHNYVLLITVTLMAIFTTLNLIRESTGREVYSTVKSLIVFTPVYLLAPLSLLVPVASFSTFLAVILSSHLKLSRSRISIYCSTPTVRLNEYVNIVFEATVPGVFKYKVSVNDNIVLQGKGRDNVVDNVKLKATRLGVNKFNVEARILDEKELVEVKHPVQLVEVTVVPAFTELVKKAEILLRKYSTYITLPRVYIGTVVYAPVETGPLEGSGVGGEIVGIRGLTESEGEVPRGLYVRSREGRFRVEGVVSGKPGSTLLDVQEAGSLMKKPSHLLELGTGFIPGIRIMWKIPRGLKETLEQIALSYIGEFMGVREYQPGDPPKMIYWKKSLRYEDSEKETLYVKVYSESGAGSRTGGGRRVILADLTSTSQRELDLLLQTLYSLIISHVQSSNDVSLRVHLYLITPSGEMYYMEGKTIDVLLALNTIIQEGKVETSYDYDSFTRFYHPVTGEPSGLIAQLINYYVAFTHAIIKDLKEKDIEKSTVELIFPKALSFKYSIVSDVLRETGYTVSIPGYRR